MVSKSNWIQYPGSWSEWPGGLDSNWRWWKEAWSSSLANHQTFSHFFGETFPKYKSQMIIWYFALLIIIIKVSMRWFSSHKDMTRISAINFTFIFFFLAILHLNFLSLKLTATGDKPFNLLTMEQNPEHDKSMQKNFSESVANVHREKSNKCNLCDYASSHAGNLRTHLKAHSGEKSKRCNQCDFASSYSSALRAHLKHRGEKWRCNQCTRGERIVCWP